MENFNENDGRWVTLDNGQKVFIREGESFKDAYKRKMSMQKGTNNKSLRNIVNNNEENNRKEIELERDKDRPNTYVVHHDYDYISDDRQMENYFVRKMRAKFPSQSNEEIKKNILKSDYKEKVVIYKGKIYKFDQDYGTFEDERKKFI